MRKLLLFIAVCAAATGFGAFDLIRDGAGKAEIRIPSTATEAESFAAGELQTYLERISGARLPITRGDDAPEGAAIILGNHPANAALLAELGQKTSDYDCFALAGDGDTLNIAAPNSSGVLYGAWEFLQQLGVEWLLPGLKGVYVPKLATIHIADQRQWHRPGTEFRSSTNYFDAGMPWMLGQSGPKLMVEEMEHGYNAASMYAWRMRLNSSAFDGRDSYRILGAGHSYAIYVPIERYHADHPEWFGLRNGKRQQPGEAWQLCFTSTEAAAEFARNAMTEIANSIAEGIPEERILLFVSPNDHEVFCQCGRCLAMIDDDGYYSSNVLNFANLVAEQVRRHYPKVKVTYYVYHTYGRVPTKVMPAEGVYPFITAWTANNSLAVNNAKPLMDPAGNRIFAQVFDWFAKHSSGVYVYPYYGHFVIFGAWPQQTQMDYDFKKMAGYPNFLGMNSESHLHWGAQPLNLYLYPKLLWNPQLDQEQAIRDFCRKAYGPAGDLARRFFAAQQAQMDRLSYICGDGIEVKDLLPPAVIAECDGLMRQIEARFAEMDADTLWRSKLLADGWRCSRLYAEAMHFLASGDKPELQVEVKARFDALSEFMNTEEGRFAVEVRCVDTFNLPAYLNMVSVNLHDLPAGESQWGGTLYYGSSLKFFAAMRGITFGLWGLYLPPHSSGSFDWKFGSRAGLLQSLTVDLGVNTGAVKVSVLQDGVPHPIAEAGGAVAVPEQYLGVPELTLRVEGVNSSDHEICWMSTARVTATVK